MLFGCKQCCGTALVSVRIRIRIGFNANPDLTFFVDLDQEPGFDDPKYKKYSKKLNFKKNQNWQFTYL
jgi:hypothetical protein